MEKLSIPLRQRLKMWMGETEKLYPIYMKWKYPANQFPCKDTYMTIEGFPRSANTFSRYLARETFPKRSISSHIHNISSIKATLRLRVPCVVIFRDPIQSVVSLAQQSGTTSDDLNSIEGYFQEWCRMYEFVLKHSNEVSLVEFTNVVGDPAAFVCHLMSIIGEEIDYESACSIAEASLAKMYAKEGSKAVHQGSLPNEERQIQKDAYFVSATAVPASRHALSLFDRLKKVMVSIAEPINKK